MICCISRTESSWNSFTINSTIRWEQI